MTGHQVHRATFNAIYEAAHAACRSAGCNSSTATTEKRRRRPAWTCLPSAALSRIAHEEISRSSRVTTSTGRTCTAWTCGSHGASPSTADSRSNRSSRCSTSSTGPTSTWNLNESNSNFGQPQQGAGGNSGRWNRVPAARRPARLQGHVLTTANLQFPTPNLGVGRFGKLGVEELRDSRAGYNFRSAY